MASILFWIVWSRKCVSKKMVIEVLGGKPARWLVGWPVAAGRSVHPSHDDDPSDPALSRSHPPVPLPLSSPSSGLGSTIMVCATVARKWFFVRFIHTHSTLTALMPANIIRPPLRHVRPSKRASGYDCTWPGQYVGTCPCMRLLVAHASPSCILHATGR